MLSDWLKQYAYHLIDLENRRGYTLSVEDYEPLKTKRLLLTDGYYFIAHVIDPAIWAASNAQAEQMIANLLIQMEDKIKEARNNPSSYSETHCLDQTEKEV